MWGSNTSTLKISQNKQAYDGDKPGKILFQKNNSSGGQSSNNSNNRANSTNFLKGIYSDTLLTGIKALVSYANMDTFDINHFNKL
jgi:hypothetical protein